MLPFYTTWKRQKIIVFLSFSGGIEMDHWAKMGKCKATPVWFIVPRARLTLIFQKSTQKRLYIVSTFLSNPSFVYLYNNSLCINLFLVAYGQLLNPRTDIKESTFECGERT